MNDLARRAFALLFAFLLVTSIPFAVVELGGPDVSPVGTARAETLVDDFEDGDVTEWEGSITAASDDPISGTYSGKIDVSGSADPSRSFTASSPSRVAATIRIDSDNGDAAQQISFNLYNGSTRVIQIGFEYGHNDIEVNDGAWQDTGYEWGHGEEIYIEIKNIDYGANTFDLWVNGNDLGSYGFQNAESDLDTIEFNNYQATTTTYVDDIEYGSNADYAPSQTTEKTLDDFEDGDVNGWQGDTGDFEIESDLVIDGSHSGRWNTSGQNVNVHLDLTASGDTTPEPSRVAGMIWPLKHSIASDDWTRFETFDDGSIHASVRFRNDQDRTIQAWDGSAWSNVDNYGEARPYFVEIVNIDYDAGTYDVKIDGDTVATGVSLGTSGGPDQVGIRTYEGDGENDFILDNVEIGGSEYGTNDLYSLTEFGVDDFEDGDKNIETDRWSGWNVENSDTFSIVSDGIDGSSGKLTPDGTATNSIIRAESDYFRQASHVEVKLRFLEQSTDTDGDQTYFTVEDANGDSIIRIEFDDRNGGVVDAKGDTDAVLTWTNETTYTVELTNINWSANEYDLVVNGTDHGTYSFETASNGFERIEINTETDASGSDRPVLVDDLYVESNDVLGGSAGWSKGTTVSGTVENQHGDPVENATVQVWGVDYSQITPDAGETKKDEALDLIEQAKNKTPTEWTDQVESDFSLTGSGGYFQSTDLTYAAVHRVDDWKFSASSTQVRNDPTLGSPLLAVDASRGETVTLAVSAWDSEKWGLRNTVSPVKNDLPGEPIESEIVIETLVASDGSVDTIQTTKTEINCNFVGCDWSSAFVEVQLTPGFYRVYPKGHESSGYVIKVGDPIEIITENLKDQSNQVVDQASDVTEKVDSGVFTKTTTTTDSNGDWSVSVGSDVQTVAVQAYKASSVSVNDTDLTYQDIVERYSDSYEDGEQIERLGSVYLPSEVKNVDPPASDVTLTVQEMTFPPYGDQDSLDDRLKDLLEEMLNETLTETFGPFLDRIEDVDRTDLETIYEQLIALYEENQELQDRIEEGDDDIVVVDDPSDATDEELQDTIDELYDEVERLGNDLEASVEEDVGTETISQTWTFNDDIQEDSVAVLIHWSNGSTTTLDLESEYLSVNKRPGLGDQVLLEDYPINDTDPASLTFEIMAIGEENGGIGRIRNSVRNPQFDGEIPTLDAIELTSLEPGSNEQVDLELHPEDPAKFDSIVSVTVTGPDGESIATDSISSNGRASGFKTSAGAGVYHVAVKFNNTDGDQFTETLRIKADQFDDDRPPSAQIRTGPTGRYLVVGDGLESGSIDVDDAGSVTVATQIQQDSDVPGSIQLYLQSLDTGSRTEVTVKVVRGSSQTTVSRRVGVILHLNAIDSDRAVLYREESEPLPRNGSNRQGQVDARENGTTIQSFTEEDGSATFLVDNDPALVDRILYRVRSLDLPGLTIFPPLDLGLSSSSAAGGLLAIGALAGGVRRWNA